jgi:hypothetical protein
MADSPIILANVASPPILATQIGEFANLFGESLAEIGRVSPLSEVLICKN